jgi:hypothetical protein
MNKNGTLPQNRRADTAPRRCDHWNNMKEGGKMSRKMLFCLLTTAVLIWGFAAAVPAIELEEGVNRPGADYHVMRARNASRCASICTHAPECYAFSFNAATGQCHLKDRVTAPKKTAGFVSGLKIEVPFEEHTDRPGGDFEAVDTPDAEACAHACVARPKCRAFTFYIPPQRCWLKSRVPVPQTHPDAVSGVVR